MALEKVHPSMVDIDVDSFNTNMKDLAETTLTASNADVYTVPASTQTIVRSIHVTNKDTQSRDLTVSLSDNSAGPAEYKMSHLIPIPVGTSVDILKNPKILEANDKIRGLASATTALDITVTGIEITNATSYFNAGLNLSTTSLTTLFTGTGSGQMIESILLTNDDGVDNVAIDVQWVTNSGGTTILWTDNLVIPAQSSVEILEGPKVIASGDTLKVQASHANRCDVVLAGRDI